MIGAISGDDVLWTWVGPLVSAVFLAITAVVLILDLEQPKRFIYILTRPQWRSWLVRGGVILGAYAATLGLHLAGSLFGWDGLRTVVAFAGLPLAVGTAVYTAYLFAQAKARDLWQSPLLAPHLAVQAVLAGAAALVPFATFMSPAAVGPLAWTVGGSAAVHLLLVAGETTVAHPTAHARLAPTR